MSSGLRISLLAQTTASSTVALVFTTNVAGRYPLLCRHADGCDAGLLEQPQVPNHQLADPAINSSGHVSDTYAQLSDYWAHP